MPVALPNLPRPTYHKLFRSLEAFLVDAARQDPSYNLTLLALYYADELSREGVKRNGKKTTGLRKDGCTPEFQHQLEIALLLTTLPNLLYRAETLTVALLHDVLEDYMGQEGYIRETFGESIYRRVQILNKYHSDGTEKDQTLYFAECANDPVTSIVKGGDNSHNQSTMHGVFPRQKVFHHIKRCADFILPMLKTGRRAFVDQNEAYENLKFILRNQCLLAVEILNAAGLEPVALPNLPRPTYHKLFRALEVFLVEAASRDPSYNLTLHALYYVDKLSREGVKRNGKMTTGLRKDGCTPEFQHQLEIALLLTTLPNLRYPAETLTVALLHDVLEDYVGQEGYILETFGESIYRRAQILNKYHPDGTEKDKVLYFGECANDPITSIVKGGDNGHNQSTMHGVFPLPKVYHHIKRCADYILPMLKKGRRTFPDQNEAYENLKFILRNQCLLAVEILNAAGFEPDEDIAKPTEAVA